MANCEVQLPFCQSIGSMPTSAERPVDHAVVAAEEQHEDQRRGGDRGGVRREHRDPEERRAAQLVVEQVGEAQRHQQLRHGGDDPDGEGVLQRVPEEVVVEQIACSCRSPTHSMSVGRGQLHLVQRGPAGVEQREQPEGGEEQEERRDEGVRAPPHVPAASGGDSRARRRLLPRPRRGAGARGRGRAPLPRRGTRRCRAGWPCAVTGPASLSMVFVGRVPALLGRLALLLDLEDADVGQALLDDLVLRADHLDRDGLGGLGEDLRRSARRRSTRAWRR